MCFDSSAARDLKFKKAMFLLQLKYETLRLLRSSALWLLLVFLVASVGFGLHNGVQRITAKRLSIGEMLVRQREDWEKQKMQADSVARNLKKVAWWQDPTNVVVVGGVWRGGWVTALEPAPQTVLATGVGDLQPDVWRLTLMGKIPQGDGELENPVNLAFGAFDLAFALAFLLPLFVIALSFNLISAEREQGTLALQLAQPVAAQRLFLMKMLARFSLLAGLTMLVTLPAVLWAGIPLTSAIAWQTVGVAVLHVLFWFLLVLGVNLQGSSSEQNALISIGAWLVFTLVIPTLVNTLAEKIHPVPSRAGYLNAMRDLDTQLEKTREERLAAFYQQHPQYPQKPATEKGWRDWYREEFGLIEEEKQVRDSLEKQYEDKATSQSAFADNLTLLSPTLSVYRQLTDLAGTSREGAKASLAALDEAQKNWASWFLKKFDAEQNLTAADYDEIIKFPNKVPVASAPGSSAGAFWLIIQCLLAGAWAWWNGRQKSLLST